jgi:hypothetical protein
MGKENIFGKKIIKENWSYISLFCKFQMFFNSNKLKVSSNAEPM